MSAPGVPRRTSVPLRRHALVGARCRGRRGRAARPGRPPAPRLARGDDVRLGLAVAILAFHILAAGPAPDPAHWNSSSRCSCPISPGSSPRTRCGPAAGMRGHLLLGLTRPRRPCPRRRWTRPISRTSTSSPLGTAPVPDLRPSCSPGGAGIRPTWRGMDHARVTAAWAAVTVVFNAVAGTNYGFSTGSRTTRRC
ncbi:YwaF family protein [Pseudonocardia sp. MCCB 268]|nr:YwaF family protein [Pseudonocardia cytotoxica]